MQLSLCAVYNDKTAVLLKESELHPNGTFVNPYRQTKITALKEK